MTELLMTAAEKLRAEKHNKMCARYKELRAEYTDVSNYRIFAVVASEMGVSVQTVRTVLIDNGLFHPKTTAANDTPTE